MMQGNDKQNPQPANPQPAQPSPGGSPAADDKPHGKPQPLDRRAVESGVPADPDPDDPVSP